MVGKALITENYDLAAWLYLTLPGPWESQEVLKLRKQIEQEGITREIINQIPPQLTVERKIATAMFHQIRKHKLARVFGKDLINLMISAYQSYLFNKILSRTIEHNLIDHNSPALPIPGNNIQVPAELDKIYHDVLRDEGIDKKRLPPGEEMRMPIENAREIKTKLLEEGILIEFFLPKGCYATIFLREFLDIML
ncbi:MAG: tRNA pseudouridine(13) synthase TruD [Candidatus Korarchaeota archaeon]